MFKKALILGIVSGLLAGVAGLIYSHLYYSINEADFYKAKLATASFFFDRILPQATACFLAIKSGKSSMMALSEDAF